MFFEEYMLLLSQRSVEATFPGDIWFLNLFNICRLASITTGITTISRPQIYLNLIDSLLILLMWVSVFSIASCGSDEFSCIVFLFTLVSWRPMMWRLSNLIYYLCIIELILLYSEYSLASTAKQIRWVTIKDRTMCVVSRIRNLSQDTDILLSSNCFSVGN